MTNVVRSAERGSEDLWYVQPRLRHWGALRRLPAAEAAGYCQSPYRGSHFCAGPSGSAGQRFANLCGLWVGLFPLPKREIAVNG